MTARHNRFKALGDFFKVYRKNAGMSQTELGKKLGFSGPQIVSNWERGDCAPPMKSMVTMAQLFDIPKSKVVELLLEENKKFLEQQFAHTKLKRAKR